MSLKVRQVEVHSVTVLVVNMVVKAHEGLVTTSKAGLGNRDAIITQDRAKLCHETYSSGNGGMVGTDSSSKRSAGASNMGKGSTIVPQS